MTGYFNRQYINRGRFWSKECSARTNQDNQRNFEEKIMKQALATLQHKIGYEMPSDSNQIPPGGIYVRLEQEFREQNRQRLAAINAQANGSGNSSLTATPSVMSVNTRPSKMRTSVISTALTGGGTLTTSPFQPSLNGDILK